MQMDRDVLSARLDALGEIIAELAKDLTFAVEREVVEKGLKLVKSS